VSGYKSIKAIAVPVTGRQPRCIQDDFCSTSSKAPGQCVYLNRKIAQCNFYHERLERMEGRFCRTFACLEAYNVGDGVYDETEDELCQT
jgi:hypothetical protein